MSTAQKVLAALAAHDLKPHGENRYRANSPLRAGSNSHAFTLKIQDDEHGTWYDHVLGEGGSLYDLAQRMNIEVPSAELGLVTTKRAYTGLEDYAAAHGVTPDELRRWRWTYEVYQGRPALRFETRGGARWRFLDGQKPHYISEKGYSACWYGLNKLVADEARALGVLFIANGEVSTVAAQAVGIPAICVTSGEKAIPDHLLDELADWLETAGVKRDALVIHAVGDCDPTGRRVSLAIKRQLGGRRWQASALDLRLGVAGGDLADWVLLHGPDAYSRLLTCQALPDAPSDVVPFGRIYTEDGLTRLPKVEYHIAPIIPKKGLVMLYGASGVGKSFLAIDYAQRLAQAGVKVCYIANEGESGLAARLGAWRKHHGRAVSGNIHLVIDPLDFLEGDELDALVEAMKVRGVSVVFVDTLVMAMAGLDENSARDVTKFIKRVKAAFAEVGTVVFVHHTNKGNEYRGSTSLRGYMDTMVKLTDNDDSILVEYEKVKERQAPAPAYMRLLPVAVNMDGQTDMAAVIIPSERIVQTPQDPLTPAQMKVVNMLAEWVEDTARFSDIERYAGLAGGTIPRVLKRLTGLGILTKHGPGEYSLSERGRKIAGIEESQESPRNHEESGGGDSSLEAVMAL